MTLSRQCDLLAGSNLTLTCDITVNHNVDTPFDVNVSWNKTDQLAMSGGNTGIEWCGTDKGNVGSSGSGNFNISVSNIGACDTGDTGWDKFGRSSWLRVWVVTMVHAALWVDRAVF